MDNEKPSGNNSTGEKTSLPFKSQLILRNHWSPAHWVLVLLSGSLRVKQINDWYLGKLVVKLPEKKAQERIASMFYLCARNFTQVFLIVFWGCISKDHKVGGLKQQTLLSQLPHCSLTGLEAVNLQPKCHRATLSEGYSKERRLAFSCLPTAFCKPWHSLVCGCFTPISSLIFTWPSSPCVSLSVLSSSYRNTNR